MSITTNLYQQLPAEAHDDHADLGNVCWHLSLCLGIAANDAALQTAIMRAYDTLCTMTAESIGHLHATSIVCMYDHAALPSERSPLYQRVLAVGTDRTALSCLLIDEALLEHVLPWVQQGRPAALTPAQQRAILLHDPCLLLHYPTVFTAPSAHQAMALAYPGLTSAMTTIAVLFEQARERTAAMRAWLSSTTISPGVTLPADLTDMSV